MSKCVNLIQIDGLQGTFKTTLINEIVDCLEISIGSLDKESKLRIIQNINKGIYRNIAVVSNQVPTFKETNYLKQMCHSKGIKFIKLKTI